MRIDQSRIEDIVRKVMENLRSEGGPTLSPPQPPAPTSAPPAAAAGQRLHGIFGTVDEAVEAATQAQAELVRLSLDTRAQIIEAIRQTGVKYAREMAERAVRETGIGRLEHKILKNENSAKGTPGIEDLKSEVFRGPNGLTVQDGIPFGVICAIAPVTNPTSTVINNGIMMIAAGNSIVFCPHPASKECFKWTMSVVNEGMIAAGGPPNLMTCVAEPTIRTAEEAMRHKGTALICATGGPSVVKAALSINKRAICAGPGNPPVIVDETARLEKAARDVVAGASFDNNLICIAEKIIICVNAVADDLLRLMERSGAHLLQGMEAHRVHEKVFVNGAPNRDWVGKDATVILESVGLRAPSGTVLALIECERDDELVLEEQLMPVVPFVRARNFDDALDIALAADGYRKHTLVLHSTNIERITTAMNRAQMTVFVANGPCYAGDGAEGEGYVAMSIAGFTGEGFTSPRTFVRQRRIALGSGGIGTA